MSTETEAHSEQPTNTPQHTNGSVFRTYYKPVKDGKACYSEEGLDRTDQEWKTMHHGVCFGEVTDQAESLNEPHNVGRIDLSHCDGKVVISYFTRSRQDRQWHLRKEVTDGKLISSTVKTDHAMQGTIQNNFRRFETVVGDDKKTAPTGVYRRTGYFNDGQKEGFFNLQKAGRHWTMDIYKDINRKKHTLSSRDRYRLEWTSEEPLPTGTGLPNTKYTTEYERFSEGSEIQLYYDPVPESKGGKTLSLTNKKVYKNRKSEWCFDTQSGISQANENVAQYVMANSGQSRLTLASVLRANDPWTDEVSTNSTYSSI